MTAKFEDSRNYQDSPDKLFDRAIIALKECGFKIKETHIETNLLKAKATFSLWSWGEIIEVNISDNGMVTTKSTCTLPSQIFSWGKNKTNVINFFKAFEQLHQESNAILR